MKYTDYLRWGTLSAIFLTLFVPFIIAVGNFWPNLFFPYITGKNFAFRILVEVALLCYVLLALREPKYRPRASLIMWVALGFVAWMAVATAFSVDPIKSFWSNFERMEGYVALVHLFVWFVITGAVLSAEKLWDRFFNTSISIAAVQGGWALMQVLGWLDISTQSGNRADTTFGNATYLAVFLLINIFLTLYMLARTAGSRSASTYRTLYGVALILELIGVLFTETRGAILGVAAGLIVASAYLIFFARGEGSKMLRRVAIGAVAFVVLFAGTIYLLRDNETVRRMPAIGRLASISLTEITVISRLQFIWPMALQGGMEKPLTGWGQENFNFVFNKNYQPGMYNQEQWFDRAHNQFLDWLVAGGVPAFLLYTALYLLAAAAAFRAKELSAGERAALLGLLAGYAFNNLFVFDNLVSGIYFFALLGYLHHLSQRREPSLAFSRSASTHVVAIVAPFVLVAGGLGIWSLNAPGLAKAGLLVEAIQTQEAGLNNAGVVVGVAKDPKKNLAEFKTLQGEIVWPGTPLGTQEATEQLLQYASTLAPVTTIDPQTKIDVFGVAADAINRLLKARPGDARLELFAGTFFAQFGQIELALQHLTESLRLSPQKQQIQIQLGMTKLLTGDVQGALVQLKNAFDAAPQYDTPRIFYAGALYYAERDAEADALLTEKFGSPIVDNNQLLQVFMNLKLFDRAVAVWKLRVQNDPNNPEQHMGLASVYFAACMTAETISELQTIARLQPTSALEMQNLQKQIQDGTLKCGQ